MNSNNPLERHLSDARLSKLLAKIHDTGAVDIVVHILEDMERTNMKLLQNAGTFEELVTCREFAKCVGMLVRKLKRANNLKKQANKRNSEMTEQIMKEVDLNGI